MAPSYIHILPHLYICSIPHIVGGTPKEQGTFLSRQYHYVITRTKFQPQLCSYASNTTHLTKSQHIQTNQTVNFTITHIIYIWDSVKIYIYTILFIGTHMHKGDDNKGYCMSHVSASCITIPISQKIHIRSISSGNFPHHITHFHLVLRLKWVELYLYSPYMPQWHGPKIFLLFTFHIIFCIHSFSFPNYLRNDTF